MDGWLDAVVVRWFGWFKAFSRLSHTDTTAVNDLSHSKSINKAVEHDVLLSVSFPQQQLLLEVVVV